MKKNIGDFLFKYRNALGPFLFLAALYLGRPAYPFGSAAWTQGNIDMLRRAGFADIMTVQKYVCFEGFLAVK